MPNDTVVEDPDLATVRELSGRRHLTPDQARTRYKALLRFLAKNPDLSHAWIGREIGCTGSNVSRLVGLACEALGVRLDQPV